MTTKHKKLTHKDAYQFAVKSLETAELKVTKPRLAILSVLIRYHGPFTKDEIFKQLKTIKIDRVTIFRSIDAFQEAGIVRRCDFGDGPVRFEYQGIGAEHHHHIICRRCGKVKDLKHCLAEGIEKFLQKAGYSHITHSMEFFGICSKCMSTP